MKFLKKGIDMAAWEQQYIAAASDCWRCPCCGAPKNQESPSDAIEVFDCRSIKDSNNCELWTEKFRCRHCKAEWESAPYFDVEHFRTLPARFEGSGMPPGI